MSLRKDRPPPGAPRMGERIWVNPQLINRILRKGTSARYNFGRQDSGRMLDGDWDLDTIDLMKAVKYRACDLHFREGISWEDTGIIDHMMTMIEQRGSHDGCTTRQEVLERYSRMDGLRRSIITYGFRTKQRLDAEDPEEPDGVFVHIDRAGAPIFGFSGIHRLAIARTLQMRVIPAQLGVTHRAAYDAGVLDRYRRTPDHLRRRG